MPVTVSTARTPEASRLADPVRAGVVAGQRASSRSSLADLDDACAWWSG